MRCPIETGEGQLLLEPLRSAALAEHIRSCRECSEFSAARRSIDLALDRWEAPAVSTDFDRRLYQRIERGVPWWEFLTRPFGARVTSHRMVVGAAAVVMVAVGLWIERPSRVAAPPQRSAAVEALPPEQAEHALEDMETIQEFGRLLRADPAEPRM